MADDLYTVERTILIAAPADRVYPFIIDFHRWSAWSPWEDIDPAMQRTYSGPEAGIGATYAWSGNRRAGRGRMQITDTIAPPNNPDAPSNVQIALAFEKPFKADNTIVLTLRPEGTSTHVTWTMTGRKTFMTKVMGLFTSMDKLVGPDFEKGLTRLKTAAEPPIP